jgi:hypothetical protein
MINNIEKAIEWSFEKFVDRNYIEGSGKLISVWR